MDNVHDSNGDGAKAERQAQSGFQILADPSADPSAQQTAQRTAPQSIRTHTGFLHPFLSEKNSLSRELISSAQESKLYSRYTCKRKNFTKIFRKIFIMFRRLLNPNLELTKIGSNLCFCIERGIQQCHVQNVAQKPVSSLLGN